MTVLIALVLTLQPGVGETSVEGSLLLFAIVLLAGLGTGILFSISLLAYWQRRSVRYLLITVAVGALFLRSIVGIGTVLGYTPMMVHHLIEHSFDFIIASLVLYAVLRSKPDSPKNSTVHSSADGGTRSEYSRSEYSEDQSATH